MKMLISTRFLKAFVATSGRNRFTRVISFSGAPCAVLRADQPEYCESLHITQSMVFPCAKPRVRSRIPKTMQNHWQNNDSRPAGCSTRTLMKPVENEHFRWSVTGEGVPFSSAPGAAVFATGRRLLPSGETHISTAAPLWRPPRG